ncbi:MAG: hypothetical protein V3T64_02255, partial [Myxococcota bacterium]
HTDSFRGLVTDRWLRERRSVPKLGRSKSEMSSATSLAAGTSQIGRTPEFGDGWVGSIAIGFEAGIAREDFPARPVPKVGRPETRTIPEE